MEHVPRDGAFLGLCCKFFSLLINSPAAAEQPHAQNVEFVLWALYNFKHAPKDFAAVSGSARRNLAVFVTTGTTTWLCM